MQALGNRHRHVVSGEYTDARASVNLHDQLCGTAVNDVQGPMPTLIPGGQDPDSRQRAENGHQSNRLPLPEPDRRHEVRLLADTPCGLPHHLLKLLVLPHPGGLGRQAKQLQRLGMPLAILKGSAQGSENGRIKLWMRGLKLAQQLPRFVQLALLQQRQPVSAEYRRIFRFQLVGI